MPYTPNPVDVTQPTGSVDASTAAAEFRYLKAYIQDKLITDDFVNLKTVFGAVGNGIADDTIAVEAAAASGKNIFVPKGSYNVNPTGNYVSMATGDVIWFASNAAKIIFKGNTTKRLFNIENDNIIFMGVEFNGDGRQPAYSLVNCKRDIARPTFLWCKWKNLIGTTAGTNATNMMYGLTISPYGIECFRLIGCTFLDFTKYNDGSNFTSVLSAVVGGGGGGAGYAPSSTFNITLSGGAGAIAQAGGTATTNAGGAIISYQINYGGMYVTGANPTGVVGGTGVGATITPTMQNGVEGIGFTGGVFFWDTVLGSTIQDQAGDITSGIIDDSCFINLQTIMAAGLTQAQQTSFNDCDGIRTYGDRTIHSRLNVIIGNSVAKDVSKRFVKISQTEGIQLHHLNCQATTALQYAMTTPLKLDGDKCSIVGFKAECPAAKPFVIGLQIHDADDIIIENVEFSDAENVLQYAPTDTAKVYLNHKIDRLTCKNIYVSGISASAFGGMTNCKATNLVLHAAPGVHSLDGVTLAPSSGVLDLDLNLYLRNGTLKLGGSRGRLSGRQEIDDAAFTGPSSLRTILELGYDPGTAGAQPQELSNFILDIIDIPNGFLHAGRTTLAYLTSNLKVRNLDILTTNALTTSYTPAIFYGDQQDVVNVNYKGKGFLGIGTIAAYAPYIGNRYTGIKRMGFATSTLPALYVQNQQTCTINGTEDLVEYAGGSIEIASATVAAGKTYAILINGVQSVTTAPNPVFGADVAKANVVNQQKF